VLLLLMLWLIIYVFMQLFQYVLSPLAIMFYYHVIFRAWNYFAVELPEEFIYARYHSKGKPNFSRLYIRLYDRIKRNRATLSNVRYAAMVSYSKQVALRLMIICGVVSTLWVTAFGLHQEYAAPAMVVDANQPTETLTSDSPYEYVPVPAIDMDLSLAVPEMPFDQYIPEWLSPAAWPFNADIVLYLNEVGANETRLRSGPGIAGYSVIEILWDNDKLVYLHSFYPDPYIRGLYWLRVLSPSGTEGYVSSQLVNVRNE